MEKNEAIPSYDEIWKNVYGDVQKYGPTHLHSFRLCKSLLQSIAFHSVLDVGCGWGYNHELILKSNPAAHYTGIDISEVAIQKAKKNFPQNEFEAFDICEKKLDKKFDLVFSSFLLEHIPNDALALKHMVDMCNRYLLIVTVGGNFEKYSRTEKVFGHVRNYNPEVLKKQIEDQGFSIKKMLQWGFPFYSPIYRTISNQMPQYGTGEFTLTTKIIARALTLLYYLNRSSKGDILFILAEKNELT